MTGNVAAYWLLNVPAKCKVYHGYGAVVTVT